MEYFVLFFGVVVVVCVCCNGYVDGVFYDFCVCVGYGCIWVGKVIWNLDESVVNFGFVCECCVNCECGICCVFGCGWFCGNYEFVFEFGDVGFLDLVLFGCFVC